MTGKERRQLNNNSGFSLVELLIAVVILAIIVIPLMRMFVSSTTINVRSRNTLRATTVAQDIMEGLKAYNIEELQAQFNNPTEGFYVTDSRLVKGAIKEERGLEVDPSGNPDKGIYCFSMAGVKLQGSVYDALIRVDGRGYMEGTTVHDNEFNSGKVSKIGGVRESNGKGSDGLYSEKQEFRKKQMLEEIGKQWKTELNAEGIAETDVTYQTPGLSISRRFILDIADTGTVNADGDKIADVMVSVEIEGSYNGQLKTFYVIDHVPCASYAGGNLYFLYYPMYTDALDEEIEVNNPDHLPLSMTIAKQIDDSAGLSDAQLMAAENNYHVAVNFTGCDKDQLKLRTNLGTSLVSKAYLDSDPSGHVSIPGQVTFQLNGAARYDLNIFDLAGIRNTALGGAGTDDVITEFIYDVEVLVYREGAAANGFPDDDRMVTIRGSINN